MAVLSAKCQQSSYVRSCFRDKRLGLRTAQFSGKSMNTVVYHHCGLSMHDFLVFCGLSENDSL